MLGAVVEHFAGWLSDEPGAVLPRPRVAARRPARAQDVPAVVVGVEVDEPRAGSLGRTLRLDDTRRELRTGELYSGLLRLEVWASSPTELDGLTSGLERRVQVPAPAARLHGFVRMTPASLSPAENVEVAPPVGTAFEAWRRQLTYRFACEVEDPVTESEGGPIRRIDIVGGGLAEAFSVPEAAGSGDG